MDETCEKVNEPVQTVGNGAMPSQNDQNLGDTHEPSPKEYEEPTFKLPVTEERKVIKNDDEKEDAPIDKETYNSYITNECWVQIRAAAKEIQPDDHE